MISRFGTSWTLRADSYVTSTIIECIGVCTGTMRLRALASSRQPLLFLWILLSVHLASCSHQHHHWRIWVWGEFGGERSLVMAGSLAVILWFKAYRGDASAFSRVVHRLGC